MKEENAESEEFQAILGTSLKWDKWDSESDEMFKQVLEQEKEREKQKMYARLARRLRWNLDHDKPVLKFEEE